ncbi:hypothetical protein UFOVP276_83 [uncultured Caudovirales phage]|uniref:Uncharacterized protein n=1 Tax=uncultured Caudovirales phage TaxID=2100421 RepID=A0A6J5LQ40_9CAUD|nr:hypothetical protein UFOVP127_220 [uncultured Caudovirales phage]CAB4135127.1 hypothetical protein UFOVP276_83 [uncultured Caudovirales phage]
MSRLVILGDSNSQYYYIGHVDEENDELTRNMDRGQVILLKNARVFHHQIFMVMGREGPNMSASTKIFPFPLSMNGGEIYVKASTYIDVERQPEVKEVVDQLMGTCKDMEQQLRVKKSGIVMASPLLQSS